MSQAYLPLPGTRLVHLSTPSVLSRSEVCAATSILEHCQARISCHCNFCCGFWTICGVGPARSAQSTSLSLLPRLVPCVLGTQCLGSVLVCRPSSDRRSPILWAPRRPYSG